MATYASLSELKTALNITNTAQDAYLASLLEQVEAFINRYLGVDTMLSSTITESFEFDCVLPAFVLLKKRPVTAISKINGVEVTLTSGVDYTIQNLRRLVLANPQILLNNAFLNTFSIEYTAGYATAPKDLVLCEIMLCSNLYAKKGTNSAYSSYAIGDEKVSFRTDNENQEALALLSQFKLA